MKEILLSGMYFLDMSANRKSLPVFPPKASGLRAANELPQCVLYRIYGVFSLDTVVVSIFGFYGLVRLLKTEWRASAVLEEKMWGHVMERRNWKVTMI